MFITLEGVEGVGKTTQCSMLKNNLQKIYPNKKIILTKEPGGGGDYSMKIRELISSSGKLNLLSELFAIYSARVEHLNNTIIDAIKSGNIVICDRYIDSSVVYLTRSECPFAQKKSLNIVNSLQKICQDFLGNKNIMPDVTFVMNVGKKEIQKRIEERYIKSGIKDKNDNMPIDDIMIMQNHYLELAKQKDRKFYVINGNHDPLSVSNEIMQKLNLTINTR